MEIPVAALAFEDLAVDSGKFLKILGSWKNGTN
jgi:hypothetical protein